MEARAIPGHVVTLVFVDLVNSTALKAALPGDDISARNHVYYQTILMPHRHRVEADLTAFGGRVIKTAGDDHFLVFINAAQAARWAAALQANHSSDPIPTPLGSLQIRIGLHAGAPLATSRDAEDYIGQEVDYAKRVSEMAAGGQILLSETAAALARDARLAGLSLHPHGEHTLQGIGRVPLFELLTSRQHAQPLSGAMVDGDETDGRRSTIAHQPSPPLQTATPRLLDALAGGQMVGRDAEITELQRRVDGARQGAGTTILLAGEPGIGKTRLATEACAYARSRGFRVLTGRCLEIGAAPYQPVVEAVLEYLTGAEPWRIEQAMPPPVACELLRIVPQIASRLPDTPQVAALAPEAARLALIEAVRQFFASVTTHETSLLLFLDDLHWADEASLALLHPLARHARNLRLLIVGTYRDVDLDTRHPFEQTLSAMNRERLYDRLSLRRLPEPAVAQMVAAFLDDGSLRTTSTPDPTPPPHAAFVSALHQETEGIPFFVEEVLKHLVEEGAIYRNESGWHIKSLREFSVPESIKVTVGRRIQRLGEESRETLTLAAVIGPRFSFEVLMQASGLEEERLLERVEEWLGAHLVVEERQGREEVYSFQHALIREVLYDAVSLRRRARLHERVGSALEATYANDIEEHLDALAHHFSQAHHPPAMEQGVAYCLQAGLKAQQIYANEEAIRHLEAAVEILDGLPGDTVHVRTRWSVVRPLSYCYVRLRAFDRARSVLSEYLRLSESTGFQWGVAAAHHEIAQQGAFPGWGISRETAIGHLEECMRVSAEHGLAGWLAGARRTFAVFAFFSSSGADLARAEDLLRRTLESPEGVPQQVIQSTYERLMEIYARQERWGEAKDVFRQSIAVGGPENAGALIRYLAVMEYTLDKTGRRSEFMAFCDEAQKTLAAAGLRFSLEQWYLQRAERSPQFHQVLFHDGFDQPQLAGEWLWHDPLEASTCDLRERRGYLTLRAPPATDLWGNNLNAPRLLREVKGDFALETRMEGDWEERSTGISGLLIWKDALSFLRFDKTSMSPWHQGTMGLQGRFKGEFRLVGRGRLAGPQYHLRLERTGERIVALCSIDGEEWLTCGTAVFPVSDPVYVGVHAIDGMAAQFDYVRVLGKPTE